MKSRIFCLLLALATPAFAAISQVQSKANWSGGTASCAVIPTSSTTNPHLVVFWATWTSTSTLTATVSDGFNTYLSAVGPTMQSATSTPTFAQLFYAKNIHGTANTITVNFTGGSASTSGCVFVEYMGLDTIYPLDSVSAGYSYSEGTAMDSGTAAPANANLLVFGGGTTDTGTAGTTGLPWSVVQNSGGSITEQLIVSGNNTLQRAPANSTASGNWVMQMAVFRAASWGLTNGSPLFTGLHSVSNNGNFSTNTQETSYLSSVLNGANPTAIYYNGSVSSVDAIAGATLVPSTATVLTPTAVAGYLDDYCNSYDGTPSGPGSQCAGVGLFGVARASVNNAYVEVPPFAVPIRMRVSG